VQSVTGTLRVKSVSGNVTVKDVTGSVQASAVSGEVKVGEINGTVSAKSTSGNVEVAVARLEGTDRIEFSSVSGNVEAKLPASLDAEVELSSLSGSLRTDFPMTIEESRFGSGRHARGRIGSGARSLRMSSVSGNVSLLRF
jgi:DUF4097 and DUF4098 domain-containing protein YvlB